MLDNILQAEREFEKALKMLEPDPVMMHNIYGSRAMSFHKSEDYRTAIKYYELYIKKGSPSSKGYQFVEESIAYIKQERFMEDME